jgi:hypothetical protein
MKLVANSVSSSLLIAISRDSILLGFLSFFLFFAFENENIKNNWIQICEIWKWNLNKNIIRRM